MSQYDTDLELAVITLATSTKTLQERICKVWEKLSSFKLIQRNGDAVYEELLKLYAEFEESGGHNHRCRDMDDERAGTHIRQIVDLYGRAGRAD